MIRALALVLAFGALAGCGTPDPCAKQTAKVCITLDVDGKPTTLDQLQISLGAPLSRAVQTPAAPSRFSLPARLALLLPDDTVGTVNVTVSGTSGGSVVATAPAIDIPLDARGRGHGSVTLSAFGGDVDLAVADLSRAIVVMPATGNFDPIDRGTTSTPMRFTVQNNGALVQLGAMATLSGTDTADFQVAGGTCPSSTLGTGDTCTLSVAFAPALGGDKSAQLDLDPVHIPLTGTARRLWQMESVPATNGGFYFAVWGSNASDVWAGGLTNQGSGSLPVVAHRQNGTWQAATAVTASGFAVVQSIWGSASNDVYLSGMLLPPYHHNADGTWTKLVTSNDSFPLVAGSSASTALSLDSTANTVVRAINNWGGETVTAGTPHAVGASGVSVVVLGENAGQGVYFTPSGGGGSLPTWSPTTLSGVGPIVSAWSPADGSQLWVGTGDGHVCSVVNVLTAPQASCAATGSSAKIVSLTGRVVTTGVVELFAADGNGAVLAATPAGTWSAQSTAPALTKQLWEATNGEVYAVVGQDAGATMPQLNVAFHLF